MKESTNGRRWIIDPIDGTRDFIRGTRAWSVLIGLEENGKVVAGHAYFPAPDEMYSAAKGEGAFWDGERIHASNVQTKNEALICCNGFGFHAPVSASRTIWSTGSRTSGRCAAWAAVSTP